MQNEFKWWQSAVFYQIYPRSFADGNGDGIGDFKGMIGKLDYLKNLGIDAVWLSPHYPSPNVDCGYDISDYIGVAPEYGTLNEFKQFLEGLHKRNIKLVLDLVMNHTSNQHPWFIESKSSLDNPKREWYIWKKGMNGNPPNDWYSTFGGSAWEFDPQTDEYYYHFFFKEQPDLNWRNPAVKQAIFDSARFWLELGVDGFRLDAVGTLFEDERYLDHGVKESQYELYHKENSNPSEEEREHFSKTWEEMFRYQHDLPEVHQVMRELRRVVDEYPDRVLIGETDEIAFYGNNNDELHLNFNFPLMRTKRITAKHVFTNQTERLTKLPEGAWPCNTLGNHDNSRMYSAFGDGVHNDDQARLNLLMLLTLKGTPFLYNGEEIGMSDYICADPSTFQDSSAKFAYWMSTTIFKMGEQEAAKRAAEYGRDRCRTPMQWSAATNAGFSPEGVTTWLPVNPDYKNKVNFAEQFDDKMSLWHYYKALLTFRKSSPALQTGNFDWMDLQLADFIAFERRQGEEIFAIFLNFSDKSTEVKMDQRWQIRLTTRRDKVEFRGKTVKFAPFTGAIVQELA
jgi:alpha-glucosidase